MPESTLTIKGQTTLPKDVRLALNLQPGDKLRYLILDDGEVRITRSRPVMDLAGSLRRKGKRGVLVSEMEEAIAQGALDAQET